MAKADKTLDIQGLVHPRSSVVIEATMDGLAHGQVLKVITNDLTANERVPALCSRHGYILLEASNAGGAFSFMLRK